MKTFWDNVVFFLKALANAFGKKETPTEGAEYPWMKVALSQVGQAERAGSLHNKQIVAYHMTTSLKATTDEVPWCSSFVNWVFAQIQYKRTNSARAKSWLEWGIKLKEPVPGCLVIFTRDGGGHVAFYLRSSKTGFVKVLGGNQTNTVKVSNYLESNVIGYRWPSEYPVPETAKVIINE